MNLCSMCMCTFPSLKVFGAKMYSRGIIIKLFWADCLFRGGGIESQKNAVIEGSQIVLGSMSSTSQNGMGGYMSC